MRFKTKFFVKWFSTSSFWSKYLYSLLFLLINLNQEITIVLFRPSLSRRRSRRRLTACAHHRSACSAACFLLSRHVRHLSGCAHGHSWAKRYVRPVDRDGTTPQICGRSPAIHIRHRQQTHSLKSSTWVNRASAAAGCYKSSSKGR